MEIHESKNIQLLRRMFGEERRMNSY